MIGGADEFRGSHSPSPGFPVEAFPLPGSHAHVEGGGRRSLEDNDGRARSESQSWHLSPGVESCDWRKVESEPCPTS